MCITIINVYFSNHLSHLFLRADQRTRQTSSASQVLPDGWRSWQNGAYATASQSRAGDSQSQPQPSTPFSPTEESRPAWDADKSFSTVRLGLTGMLRLMLAQCLSCLHLVTLQDEQLAWDGNAGKSMLEVGQPIHSQCEEAFTCPGKPGVQVNNSSIGQLCVYLK